MQRSFLAAAGLLCSLLYAATAAAQTYPSHPVKILVPFPAGSSTDEVARLIGNELQTALGQPFVVDNRAGAQGTIAADAVAKSAPDGYTLLLTTNSPLATDVSLFNKLPYDPVKDFAPIARIGVTAFVLMTRPDFKAKSLKELIDLAHAEPNKLSAGFGGGGGQVSQALFKSMAKVEITDVPYRGVPQAVTDTLGGTVTYAFVDLGNAAALASSKQLIPLGQTLPQRTKLAPGVPAIGETFAGLPGRGLVRPRGAGGNAAGRRQQTLSDDRRRAGKAGSAACHRADRHRRRRARSGEIFRLYQERNSQMGGAGQDLGNEGAINARRMIVAPLKSKGGSRRRPAWC